MPHELIRSGGVTPIQGTGPVDPTDNDLVRTEQLRLAALRRYGILDTPPEPQFDHLVQLAARVFDMPMALVTFVDEDRQWFKARHGLPVAETPPERVVLLGRHRSGRRDGHP